MSRFMKIEDVHLCIIHRSTYIRFHARELGQAVCTSRCLLHPQVINSGGMHETYMIIIDR